MNGSNLPNQPRCTSPLQPSATPKMNQKPRIPLLALAACLGTALAPFAPAAPLADSATGVGTVLGNSLNRGPDLTRSLDSEWAKAKHTPSGQPFKIPFALPRAEDLHKSASGWEYSGQIEFGYLGGDADEDNARFRMYQDIDEGAYVNNFSFQMKRPESGHWADVTGGGAGRHDQYYGIQFGHYNAWKVKVFFSETPHVFTDRYKSLWSGIGTGYLTLLPGLTPGGTASIPADNAAVAAAAAKPETTLSLTRKRGGIRVDADLTTNWKGYFSYALEKRKGARPLGAVWGGGGGTAPMELAEPIDYDTEDLLAGVTYKDGVNALNVRLTASLFHNNIDTLTFQEPYRIPPAAGTTTVPAAGAFTQGRFDLYPDSTAFNTRAEYTRSLPDFYKGYLTAVVAAGKWRQDDTLIPYTTIPNISLTNVTLLSGGAWDTVGALSRPTTGAGINTRLADLTLSLHPTASLNVKGKVRYHDTDNVTNPYLAVNPNAIYVDADSTTAGSQSRGLTLDGVTGVWGRLINDGSGQVVLLGQNATPAGNIPIKSAPYSSQQTKYGVTADYGLNKVSSFNAAVDREVVQRDYRERDRTWEDKAKVGYVNRGLWDSTLRVSYEYGRRRGDDYIASTYDQFFSPAIFALPATAGTNVTNWAARTNTGTRALDLADRNQHVVNGRFDTSLRPNLDAGFSVQLKDADYPDASYGLARNYQRSANLDLNYQPSPRQTIYGFYSYQIGWLRQAAIAQSNVNIVIGQASPQGPTFTPANAIALGAAPGGPQFPLINTWTAKSTDRNHVLGVGLKQEIGKASLNVDYSYSTGRTRIGYAYTIGGALNAANAPFAGDRMPDLALDTNYLDASLRFPLTQRLSARLVYRYQKESIRDWHYRNLETTPVVLGGNGAAGLPTALMLDGGASDYKVNWYGVMLQIKL